LDLVALGLLALHLFLALSLLTYDPADPPSTLTYPPRTETHNACGPLGALVARTLLCGFGVGAYFLVLSSAAVTILLLRRQTLREVPLRFGGWLLILLGICTLASFAWPRLSPGPVIGPGGYLGAAGRGLLEANFAWAGSFILICSVLIGGLILCTEELLARSARLTWRLIHGGVGGLRTGSSDEEREGKRPGGNKITLPSCLR